MIILKYSSRPVRVGLSSQLVDNSKKPFIKVIDYGCNNCKKKIETKVKQVKLTEQDTKAQRASKCVDLLFL
jgi:hypothetical protein